MTGSQSNNNSMTTLVRSGLFVAALCAATGAAVAQETAGARYAQMLRDADITQQYNAHIQQQIASQEAEIASLEQQAAGLDAVAVEVQPLLERMFTELESFVAADLPFLRGERTARIDRLRELMGRVDASASEKYRRLMEAYQIEMEYGRTLDTYREAMADGREADFIRLGRVTLMYRTADGSEYGYWDNEQKTWVADPGHARQIEQALRIAKEEEAPDLITVPVPAPQGGRS
jgi:hypothetical protein